MGGVAIVIDGISMTMEEYQVYAQEQKADRLALEASVKKMYTGISTACATAIVYLRSTTRWSAEAEQVLVLMSRTGQKLPDVYAGQL